MCPALALGGDPCVLGCPGLVHWGARVGGWARVPAPQAGTLGSLSLQKSALIVRGPREVQKRELVFLQFRLNQSSEDFSAIDYLLFSSFQEFLHRCPSEPA